jgi:hypothetical protein
MSLRLRLLPTPTIPATTNHIVVHYKRHVLLLLYYNYHCAHCCCCLQLERCRTTVFYTGKGDSADAEFRNLATVLGYEHKLDASRRGFAGLSSHHRSKPTAASASASGEQQQQQQEFVRAEGDTAVCDDASDEDEQARRLIAAEESQSPITPVNFQVRTHQQCACSSD